MKKIFIGSSNEKFEYAEFVAGIIRDLGQEPILWKGSEFFIPSGYTFDALEKINSDVDAAIFIFAADDKTWCGDKYIKSVRDNVILEYGLFTGHHSRKNVCICTVGSPKQISDLKGITYVEL